MCFSLTKIIEEPFQKFAFGDSLTETKKKNIDSILKMFQVNWTGYDKFSFYKKILKESPEASPQNKEEMVHDTL